MPLVKIDVIKGQRSNQQLRKIADVIQQVLMDHFNAPTGDRYQIISQHEADELICEDSQLGYNRTDKLVVVQILQQGRDTATKQKTFVNLAKELETQCDVQGSDLVVACTDNTKADWSFGNGEAQFLTGKL